MCRGKARNAVDHSLQDKNASKSIEHKLIRLSGLNLETFNRIDKEIRLYSGWETESWHRYLDKI